LEEERRREEEEEEATVEGCRFDSNGGHSLPYSSYLFNLPRHEAEKGVCELLRRVFLSFIILIYGIPKGKKKEKKVKIGIRNLKKLPNEAAAASSSMRRRRMEEDGGGWRRMEDETDQG